MSAASLVVKRLLEKKPKTRQDIQLIKLEVAREEKFDSIPPNNQLLAEIDAKEEPEVVLPVVRFTKHPDSSEYEQIIEYINDGKDTY